MSIERVDVLVIGGGPAGLSAAIELRRLGAGSVVVLDREGEFGGAPRHSRHQGYGVPDLHRSLTGPSYARRLARDAARAGTQLRSLTSVVEWAGERSVHTTSPTGMSEIEGRAVVLATGCRERPRSARLIAGSRPEGVFTTGSLQQHVSTLASRVGCRAVVVGAEHVSFSAVMTLRHAGIAVVAMVTPHARHQSFAALRLFAAGGRKLPILCGAGVSRIYGRARVEGVEITDLATGAATTVGCDTLVFTGDWMPENELARRGGIAIDPGSYGPQVDARLRTSAEGIFAAGNLVHGGETAAVAALAGRRVAATAHQWLQTGTWPSGPRVPVVVEDPIAWIVPNALQFSDSEGLRLSARAALRVRRFVADPRIEVHQGARLLWTGTADYFIGRIPAMNRRLVPNRSIRIGCTWIEAARGVEPVTVRLAGQGRRHEPVVPDSDGRWHRNGIPSSDLAPTSLVDL